MFKKIIVAGMLAISVLPAIAKEISFGIIATDSASAQRERWEPFFKDMEKAKAEGMDEVQTFEFDMKYY